MAGLYLTYAVILLGTSPWCQCAPVEDRDFEGRFSDKVSFNVLSGTDAVFTYTTYPFNETHRMVFDKLTDQSPFYLGSCVVNDTARPCTRNVGRVAFRNPPHARPYVILSNVTKTDAGRYRTRVIKEKAKLNPELIDIETTVSVYEESDFVVSIDVTNVHGATYQIALNQTPFRSPTPVAVVPGQVHTWSVRLQSTSPLSNITLTKRVGNISNPSVCVYDRRRCSEGIKFSSTDSNPRNVSVNVNFNTQNVRDFSSFFPIALKEPVGAEQNRNLRVILPITIIASILLVAIIVFTLKSTKETKKKIQQQKQQQQIEEEKRLENELEKYRLNLMANDETGCQTLSGLLVSDENLTTPDFVYDIDAQKIILSSMEAQKIYAKIIKVTTSLINTCGGLIKLRTDELDQLKWRDCVLKNIKTHISSGIVDALIRFQVHLNTINLYILPSQRLVCLDDGLSARPYDHIVSDTDIDILRTITLAMSDTDIPISDPGQIFEKTKLTKCVSLVELDLEANLELKQELLKKIKEYLDEPEGGDIMFGVNDKDVTNPIQLVGYDRNSDLEAFSDSLGELYNVAAKESNIDSKQDRIHHWFTQKIHLYDNEESESRNFILKWHIYGKSETRFLRLPIVYAVNFDGNIYSWSLDDFAKHFEGAPMHVSESMTETDYSSDIESASSETEPLLGHNNHLKPKEIQKPKDARSNTIPLRIPVVTATENKWYRDGNMKVATDSAIKEQVLSWTRNARSWAERSLPLKKINEHGNQKTLSASDPLTFIPPIPDVMNLVQTKLEPFVRNTLNFMKKWRENGHAIMLRKRMFGSEEDFSIGIDDLYYIIFSSNSHIELLAFKMDNENKIQARAFLAGRKFRMALTSHLRRLGCPSTAKYLTLRLSEVVLPSHPDLQPNIKELVTETEIEFQDIEGVHISSISAALYSLAATSDARIRNHMGAQKLLELSQEQSEILNNLQGTFNFIDGPPGSGKSVIAITLYKQQERMFENKVYFSAPTAPFLDFCTLQGIKKDHIIILKEECDLNTLAAQTFKSIIIDDVQHIQKLPLSGWNKLFTAVHENKGKLYLFGDSVYQNYKDMHAINEIKNMLTTFCEQHGHQLQMETLSEVRRNSQKVFSFMMSHRPENAGLNQMCCNHDVEGDDILVYPIENYRDNSNMNGVLHIVNNLLGKKDLGVLYNHQICYQPFDIALLVDGDEDEKDVDFFMALFRYHLPNIETHRANHFPTTGMVIDTLENYCGLEANVCVFVQGNTSQGAKNLKNDRYNIYVASRGVQLVIYVQSRETLTVESADNLHFDKLGNVVSDHYSAWYREVEDIPAILGVVVNAKDDDCVHGALSAVIALYKSHDEEQVAEIFINNNGINSVVNHIKNHRNEKIRERSLICLTRVALIPKFRGEVLSSGVIQPVRGTLGNKWQAESWEACYLLCHLMDCGNEKWPSGKNDFTVTMHKVNETISGWDKEKPSGVAQGDTDFRTFTSWLESTIPVRRYLAAWSLYNLVKTKGEIHIASVTQRIGLAKLIKTAKTEKNDSKVKTLLEETISRCKGQKVLDGAIDRQY